MRNYLRERDRETENEQILQRTSSVQLLPSPIALNSSLCDFNKSLIEIEFRNNYIAFVYQTRLDIPYDIN